MLTQILSKHVTPNHLLFARQLLYSSNAISTVVRNVTVFSSTTDKINHSVPNYFWDRWRYEYVVNLRKTLRASKLNSNSPKINVNDIVLVDDKKVPIHFWRIAIVPAWPTKYTTVYVTFEGQNYKASFSKELKKVRGQRVV